MNENQSSVRIYSATDGKRLELNYGGRNPHHMPVNTEMLLLIQEAVGTELMAMFRDEELK